MTAIFSEKYDHVTHPKSDGYRGVHFVYKYRGNHPDRAHYNGLRIEVQIRSVYQHAWATALETIDTFTWQSLKAGLGKPEWRRFFLLVSSFIALMEKRPRVEGIEGIGWVAELHELIKRLNIIDTLEGIRTGLHVAEDVKASGAYILILDSKARTTEVLGFDSNEDAAKHYKDIERKTIDEPNIQAVQVSVDSVSALHEAYPNYYLDTARFIGILEGFIRGASQADLAGSMLRL